MLAISPAHLKDVFKPMSQVIAMIDINLAILSRDKKNERVHISVTGRTLVDLQQAGTRLYGPVVCQ